MQMKLFVTFITYFFIAKWMSAQIKEFDTCFVADNQPYEIEKIAELSYIKPVTPFEAPDSADVKRLDHKSFWRGSAEVVGLNLTLWAFDRFIRNAPFSHISFRTIGDNFRRGFIWDNDELLTNLFSHPYNGSFYYNAGRSNGYNYWQSALFAIGGSAMWELFMEKEYPSTNDVIATPIGGTAIGEVLYRTSDMILDDRATGVERGAREAAAFVLSPMRGLTRIFTGRAWQHRSTTGRRFGMPMLRLQFSLGSRMLLFHDGRNYSKVGLSGKIYMEYGDKFASSTRHPYDYFTFLLDFDGMKTQPLLSRVEITGRLLSKELYDSPSSHLSIGMYQHYDFMDSDTISPTKSVNILRECLVPYKLGIPASAGAGVIGRHTHGTTWQMEGHVHVNAVLLGGILTDFYRNRHRNYNWGSGFSLKGSFNWFNPVLGLNCGLNARYYHIYTLKGCEINSQDFSEYLDNNVQGDKGNSGFLNLQMQCNYRLWRNLFLTAMFDWYNRRSHYLELNFRHPEDLSNDYSPIFNSNQVGLKLMLTYNL